MTRSQQMTILECGFLPPDTDFVKSDPRGAEYGYFQIPTVTAGGPLGGIRVIKHNATGVVEWACVFDDQVSFGNWARDCT